MKTVSKQTPGPLRCDSYGNPSTAAPRFDDYPINRLVEFLVAQGVPREYAIARMREQLVADCYTAWHEAHGA